MQEFYLVDNALISQPAWAGSIGRLHARAASMPEASLDTLKQQWLCAFEHAVLSRAKGQSCVGVLFSGGVDSTFIAYVLWKHKVPFTCYTAGFKDPRTKDPEDILEARRTAEHYGWPHKYVVHNLAELEPLMHRTASVLGDVANPVTCGVGAVIVAAAELAKQDGITVLFGGLGSEEIFAGYHRHDKAHRTGVEHALSDEAWSGMLRMYERDMLRDSRIAAALGISVPTPFLDPQVMALAMQMPDSEKIKDGHKKYILRVMACEYGLAQEFAFRPKRAAQYGSRMHKAISRLAKRQLLSEDDYIKRLSCSFPNPPCTKAINRT